MSGEPSLYGIDLFGAPVKKIQAPLAEKWGFPPFSVLDAKQGEWQERKAAWISLGLKSEVGRDTEPGGSLMPAMDYTNGQRGDGKGRALDSGAGREKGLNFGVGVGGAKSVVKGVQGAISTGTSKDIAERFEKAGTGASIFDPVLCELAYRWWCPPDGLVLDPFAGGSVRGIVASLLGRRYWGCDLRAEQIAANEEQAATLCVGYPAPTWVCGDSNEQLIEAPRADLIIGCPPYGDLEVYSDDHRDLSNMPHRQFMAVYDEIIAKACAKLRRDRFACWVIGDFRDERGNYRNFVADTIGCFRNAGLALYNDAVLLTAIGSLPVRAGKQFQSGRKLGRCHQNVLVFVKGSGEDAAAACNRSKRAPDVEMADGGQ